MKNSKKCLSLLMAAALSASMLTGCGSTEETTVAETTTTAAETTTAAAEETYTSYLDVLDDKGYFKDIRALDYVTLPKYDGIEIDFYTHNISEEELQNRIDSIMVNYAKPEQIMEGEIKDGDTVNIDYVGSIDGVEFEGGTTNGLGASVTIGVTSYIDDFLEQLIGHKPGDTVNVEVTFPEDYGKEELNGKDALFVTTINYIEGEDITPELTDEFVVENLEAYYGWKTTQEVKDYLTDIMKASAEENFVLTYLMENAQISEIPEVVRNYSEESYLAVMEDQLSSSYGMTLEDYATTMGVTVEDIVAQSEASILEQAKQSLIFQAIAEDMNMEITEEDIKAFFLEQVGTEDYTAIEDYYGIGYIKNAVNAHKILNYSVEHAVRLEQ